MTSFLPCCLKYNKSFLVWLSQLLKDELCWDCILGLLKIHKFLIHQSISNPDFFSLMKLFFGKGFWIIIHEQFHVGSWVYTWEWNSGNVKLKGNSKKLKNDSKI